MRAPSPTILLCAAALAAGSAACKPDLGNPISLVTEPRLLAVRGDPPEVAPGSPAGYSLLLASPTGPVAGAMPYWAYCPSPKPPAEANSVSAACLDRAAVPDQDGPASIFTAVLPADACTRFGPVPPEVKAGEAPSRPRDPDVTGGYYQPVRVAVSAPGIPEMLGFALERIRCNLASAPVEVVREYNASYTPNQNPVIAHLSAAFSDRSAIEVVPEPAIATGTPALILGPGEAVTLQAAWPEESAESFPVFDQSLRALVTQREALRVSWFVTAGELDHDATGRTADDPATTTDNRWVAPLTPGPVHLWLVLHDSRGGLDFEHYPLYVR